MTDSAVVSAIPVVPVVLAVPAPVTTPFIQLLGQSGGCCEGDSCGI